MTQGGASLHDIIHSLDGDTRNLRLTAAIGVVTDNKDPDGLNRVRLAFNWNLQGTHTAGWAMPVYPLSGDLGSDPPDEGDYLFCLFLDGAPNEPFYLGKSRGKPKKKEIEALSQHRGENLGIAVAEAVSAQLQDMLDWMRSHTHPVIVTAQGISATPGAPIVGTPARFETMSASGAVPQLRKIKALKLRLSKRNDPDSEDPPAILPEGSAS